MVGGGTSTQRGGHIMFPSTQFHSSQFLIIASRVKNINLVSPLFKIDLFSQLPLRWHRQPQEKR
ncbi:unnamed protein product [Musa acuminata subsp. burmannicoides]